MVSFVSLTYMPKQGTRVHLQTGFLTTKTQPLVEPLCFQVMQWHCRESHILQNTHLPPSYQAKHQDGPPSKNSTHREKRKARNSRTNPSQMLVDPGPEVFFWWIQGFQEVVSGIW